MDDDQKHALAQQFLAQLRSEGRDVHLLDDDFNVVEDEHYAPEFHPDRVGICISIVPTEHGERFADEYRKMFPRQQVTLEPDEELGRVLMHTKPGLTTKQMGKWTGRWHQLSRELRIE